MLDKKKILCKVEDKFGEVLKAKSLNGKWEI